MNKVNIIWVGFLIILSSCGTIKNKEHAEAYSRYKAVVETVNNKSNQPERVKYMAENIDTSDIIFNDLELYKYYLLFQSELSNRGFYVDSDILNVKYLFIEEGITNGPDLGSTRVPSYSNKDKQYILFSPKIKNNPKKLRTAMFKELTHNLGLGINNDESIVLANRTSDGDYSSITQKNYDDLFDLIVQKINSNHCLLVAHE
jgi:hypothetical protein